MARAEDQPWRRPAPSFLPATAVLELTYRCNHACRFCSCPWFAPGGSFDVRPELGLSEWKGLIDTLCRMGVCNLSFTGGEPLLKEGLLDLIAHAAAAQTEHIETEGGRLVARRAPPHLYLISNAKAMSDGVIDACRRHGVNLMLSLPGLSAYGDLTQGGMTPDHVLSWLAKAHAAGVTTTVGVTVTRPNAHELYETIASALLAGADSLLLNRFLPGGRGLAHAADLALTAPQLRAALDTAEEVLVKAGRYGALGTEVPACVVDPARFARLKVGTRCGAATGFFVIDPSGYVRTCNHSPLRLLHASRIDELPADPYWRRFALREYLPAACGGCPRAGGCDAGCREAAHIVRGAPDALDPIMTGVGSTWQPEAPHA